MSTNSRIGIKRLDGTEKYIYCHWDGYIEHNGLLLQLCYDKPEKIERLLELGNLSVLGEYLETDEPHSFESQHPNVCVAYHRDRGEELELWESQQEFNYTFDESVGAWIVGQQRYGMLTGINVNVTYEYCRMATTFLIDEIINKQDKIMECWEDDEFATKENLIETLKEKAKAQVAIANKRKQEEYDFWYRAYCD